MQQQDQDYVGLHKSSKSEKTILTIIIIIICCTRLEHDNTLQLLEVEIGLEISYAAVIGNINIIPVASHADSQ